MKIQLTAKMMGAAALAALALVATGEASTTASSPKLSERLIASTELPDFATVYCPEVVDDAYRWAERYTSTASLKRNGFVAGLSAPLYSTLLRAQAVTSVAQFRSEDGAQAELRREAAAARRSPGSVSAFTLPSIPGAFGITLRHGALVERDVFFRAGHFVFRVGVTYRVGSSTPISEAQVDLAAAALYARAS
jgi:hypothetical protein